MRRRPLVAGLLVATLLAAAHWFYWYRPRERAGAPRGDTVPGRIFRSSELPYRLWLPYPHQNLAELEAALGDAERLLRAVAVLSGRPLPQLPAFGAARVPPAHELVLATDDSGERFVAAARVYPVAGQLARWAGRLAGNPLLAGGRTEISGRTVEAGWTGGTWTVRTPEAGAAPAAAPAPRGAAALAWLAMGRARGPLPAGEFALRRAGRDLVLEGGDPAALARLAGLEDLQPPLPLLVAETFRARGAFAARTLGLLPGTRSLGGLPGAVAASLGPKRWPLPGEGLLDLVGDGAPRRHLDGWRVVALEEESLSRAAALVELAGGLAAHPPLGVAVWLEIDPAQRLVEQVVEALEAVPVIGAREARRWRAAADVLAPLAGYRRLTAFVSAEPAAVRLRLEARRRAN